MQILKFALVQIGSMGFYVKIMETLTIYNAEKVTVSQDFHSCFFRNPTQLDTAGRLFKSKNSEIF